MDRPNSPSELVFDTARDVCNDMRDGIDAAICDMEDYALMLKNMRDALRRTRSNLNRHAMPITGPKSEERRMLKMRLRAIDHAMKTAKKIEAMLDLTIEDISEVMRPYQSDEETEQLITRIMGP